MTAETNLANTGSNEPRKFEEALEKLEKIVDEMENGELTLEQSLAHFEQGMKLAKQCGDRLGKAEKKIEKLVTEAGGENGQWTPFNEED